MKKERNRNEVEREKEWKREREVESTDCPQYKHDQVRVTSLTLQPTHPHLSCPPHLVLHLPDFIP